jgi:repressor LexA
VRGPSTCTDTHKRGPEGNIPVLAVDLDRALALRLRNVPQANGALAQCQSYPHTSPEIREAIGLAGLPDDSYQTSILQTRVVSHEARRSWTAAPRSAGRLTIQQEADETGETHTDTAFQNVAHVPVVGWITAGRPVLAEESIEDTFPLPRHLVGHGTLFLLQVVGDSMINAAITDGDWVVIRQQPTAENGEIVAAMIDGEATVKRFKKSTNRLWLIPENPAYTPIQRDDAIILGRVVVVLRQV